ncbi:MAG: hypothetical protein GF368_04055 [Candidatus Aenigmarchaeota archaeon]|nr:hypothetical protein [Candidatus Aenigmarchaeota archaeon]
MSKGIAIETVFKLVLGILVMTVISYFLLGQGGTIMKGVVKRLQDILGMDIYEEETRGNLLKEAIQCAYDRCEDGCLEIEDNDFSLVNCKSDFCEDEQWMDNDFKICGFNALQYPVEVELEGDLTIDVGEDNSLSNYLSRYDCILPLEGDADFIDYIYMLTMGDIAEAWNFIRNIFGRDIEMNVLIFENSLIDEDDAEKTNCVISGETYGNSYEKMGVNEGKMYLYSSYSRQEGAFVTDMNAKLTLVKSDPSYKTIPYNVDRVLTFASAEEDLNYRIVAKGDRGDSGTHIRFDTISQGYVGLLVGCGGGAYTGEYYSSINLGTSDTFCEGYINIEYLDYNGGNPELLVRFNDPECHLRDPEEDTCAVLCKGCMINPLYDLNPNMCCYKSESCIDGVCENYEATSTTFGYLECGDICNPSDNNCPSICPSCEEFPDGNYRCDVPSELNIFPQIGAFPFEGIQRGDTFQSGIFLFGENLEEGEEITCTWRIEGTSYGTGVFTNEDFEEISDGIYKLDFESEPVELNVPGNYIVTINVDADDVDETDKTDNSDSKSFTYLG